MDLALHLTCDTLYKKKQIFELEHLLSDLYSDDDNNAMRMNDDNIDNDREVTFEHEDEANDVSTSKVKFENKLNV